MEGSAYPPVSSSDVPCDSVSEDPLIAHVGKDFVGPLYVRTDKNLSESSVRVTKLLQYYYFRKII